MKYLSTFSIVAMFFLFLLTACKNEGDAARDAAVQSVTPAPADATAAPATTPPPTQEPPQNAEGVWHYTCPKGCAGGAGTATACASCGTTLAHNQAYHGNANPTASPTITQPATPAPAQEPAQNAKGVWHYTCSKGCAGGAGSAIACSKCGSTLAHNAAYHQ
ncbi:MAG: hypothetical protein H6577_15395 [Lewinellaceae bacterium]|nr:hypothetical protein [Saprospiraceae bacterium]MCB9339514.1 hypothetical protein [Lewinellaceae bacterium]